MSDRGRIVIIDDDTSTADLLTDLLAAEGYVIGGVTPGPDVVSDVEASGADVVVIDAHLESVDPFAVGARLRAGPVTQDLPVLFMTQPGDSEARLKGLASGDDLIARPFDAREVLARLERQVTISKVRVALRESEAKFRSVMESAIDAIISGDADGCIRAWNSAATALFGFTAEEVIGRSIDVIIPERFRASHRQGVHRVSSGGPAHVIGKTVELAALRRDGSEFPVELSLATWHLDGRRFYTGIIRDISERKQAEEKFRSVTDSAIDAIISADHGGTIVSWNRAATRILGYTEEDAIGQQLELIIPERFHDAHREGMRRVTAGGESRVIGNTVELAARRKDGLEVPIELSLSTWMVRGERFYSGIIRDIRERKRAEDELRHSEQSLQARTLELKNKNDELETALTRLHEMQAQVVVQEKMASLGRLSAGMAHELNNPASAAQRAAAGMRATLTDWQRAQRALGRRPLSATQQARLTELEDAARAAARRPPAFDGLLASDREAGAEAWLAERGVELAADLSPALVSLEWDRGDLEQLAGDFPGEDLPVVLDWLARTHAIHGLVDEVGLGTDRVVQIVRALKSYSFMDRAPVQAVDVRQGLTDTLVMLKSKLTDGVVVRREDAGDVPAIQAHGGELNQVWTNLIDNAIDAMQGRGILTVRTRADDGWVVVEVEDDGPGVPGDILSEIFDPFFTTKAPGDGTGLGLSISRNIVVQKHEGELTVASEPGRTTFTVRLPVR